MASSARQFERKRVSETEGGITDVLMINIKDNENTDKEIM